LIGQENTGDCLTEVTTCVGLTGNTRLKLDTLSVRHCFFYIKEDVYHNKNLVYEYTVKLVYNSHSREPVNVTFMSSCPLYTGQNNMHFSLMGENETAL